MANKSRTIYKIILLISFCCLLVSHAAANYVLNQGDALNSSGSLVSRNGLFALKFEHIGGLKDSVNSYLGTRYLGDRVTNQPFWIANRNSPITDNSGALILDETGKLMITYNGGAALELYSGDPSNTTVYAILQDDGNFVLKKASTRGVPDQTLWQSFDFPTDSFLPGMKLGINSKTNQNWTLTSWLTESIPAPGAFSLEWNPDERQLILRRRGVAFWTSGVLLEDNTFENIELDFGLTDHKFYEVSNEDEKYLWFEFLQNENTPKGWITLTWLWLKHSGTMVDQNTRNLVLHSELCDGNSIASGCKRWGGPKCRRAGLFRRQLLVTHNITDSSSVNNANLSLGDCKDICWQNCTCFGTKSRNHNGTGCVFFYEPLKEITNGTREVVYTISYIPSDGKEHWIWVVTTVAGTFVIGILFVIFFLLMRWRRSHVEEKFLLELMNEAKELEIEGKKGFNLKVYSVSSIMNATNCFSDENKLGEGGYGPVYMGSLDGQEIAIKRLSRTSRQGLVEFKNELIIVAKLQHTNLVRLLGFCIQGEEKMLIYEYMPNNSLDSYIFG